jgi:lincosamide nucleotidyltransferase A/C/D/E
VTIDARDVLDVLALLADGGVEQGWLDGGWGIEALIGAQHRDHADLDLVVPIGQLDLITGILAEVGFETVVDERPTRVALRDRTGREVDLHLVRIDESGTGWQARGAPGGGDVEYPADSLTFGWVGGERVECIGPELQLEHHLGYPPTDRDREDMARLCERFTMPLPEAYK